MADADSMALAQSTTRNRRIGRIMVNVGDLLMVATLFTPWLELETSFCSTGPVCRHHYSPWYLIYPGIPDVPMLSPSNPLAVIAVCAIVILICSVLVLTSQRRRVQRLSIGVLVTLSIVCLLNTGLIMAIFPLGLAITFPFYSTTIIYGSLLAIVSFSSIFAGAIFVWPE